MALRQQFQLVGGLTNRRQIFVGVRRDASRHAIRILFRRRFRVEFRVTVQPQDAAHSPAVKGQIIAGRAAASAAVRKKLFGSG